MLSHASLCNRLIAIRKSSAALLNELENILPKSKTLKDRVKDLEKCVTKDYYNYVYLRSLELMQLQKQKTAKGARKRAYTRTGGKEKAHPHFTKVGAVDESPEVGRSLVGETISVKPCEKSKSFDIKLTYNATC